MSEDDSVKHFYDWPFSLSGYAFRFHSGPSQEPSMRRILLTCSKSQKDLVANTRLTAFVVRFESNRW